MKKRTTKHALLTSIMSLVLCFAMLLGTTFAWFTDTASTAVNKIQAGNLDVEVEYQKSNGDWASIEGASTLFSSNLWEPGHTEFVYLRVKNAGTLGLKYKVMVTPVTEKGGINVEGDNFKLSDYLVFGTYMNADKSCPSFGTGDAGRAAARAAAGAATGLSAEKQNALTKTGTMVGKNVDGYADQYLALVVYMPESVDNKANAKPGTTAPSIDLGITVVATQLEAEDDSFGPDYDADAATDSEYTVGPAYNYFPQVMKTVQVSVNPDNTVATPVAIEAAGKLNSTDTTDTTLATVSVPIGAALKDGVSELTVKVAPTAATNSDAQNKIQAEIAEGREVANFDIKVDGIDAEHNNKDIEVSVFVGTGLNSVRVFHNGTQINDAVYNASTGFATFKTTSFSDFTVTYEPAVAAVGTKTYGTLQLALDAVANQGTVVLLKDVEVDATLNVSKDVTLNLAGNVITGNGVRAIHVKGGTLKLAGSGTVSSTVGNVGSSVIRVGSDEAATAGLVVEKGITISTATAYGITVFGATSESVMISGTVTSTAPENTSYDGCAISTLGTDTTAATITINDGATISAANTNAIYMPSGNLTVKGGTITGRTGIYVKSSNTTITGGTVTGNGPASAYQYYGNGGISTGDALVVDSCGYPNGKPVVVVRGGTFLSTNAKAVASYNKEGNELVTGFIKKGTFSSDPTDCMASGYFVTQNGQRYSVSKTEETLTGTPWHELDALTGDFYYDGEGVVTVTDFQEFHFAGNANITIKGVIFGNGLTIYTNDVNASGTITLEDCVVYLNDGTGNPKNASLTQHEADYGVKIGANGKNVKYIFNNCTFAAKEGHVYKNNSNSYNVYIGGNYSADSITFTGCTFEDSGKHGIGCSYWDANPYTNPANTYFNLTVTGCNFKNWMNNSEIANKNGAAIRGNVPANVLTTFNKTIKISDNTFGESNGSTQQTVAIDDWTGSWS